MDDIDIALAALADPTRRQVIELLLAAPRRTNELADALGVSVPAVSRHLRVLRDRELVDRVDVPGDGRGREYRLNPARLETLTSWLGARHWTNTLTATPADAETRDYLSRVGGFLDGFAQSDSTFFEQHLADDVELIFPGSAQRWDKASTVASVAGHAPYVSWTISDTSIRPVSPTLTLVAITVSVQTTTADAPTDVVQSMLFDDGTDPWTLRFLQQTPI